MPEPPTSLRSRMTAYRSPAVADAYREKHRRSWTRRLGDWRERTLICRMLRRLPRLDSVLDCACGAGRFLPSIGAYARQVWAIDQSGPMVQLAREASPSAWLAIADAGALPLSDGSVDAVVCSRLLHHFPEAGERVRILSEASRVARRAVIVSFADAETWKGRRAASRRRAIPQRQLRLDSLAANLTLEPPVLRVGSLFSRFAVDLLRVPKLSKT